MCKERDIGCEGGEEIKQVGVRENKFVIKIKYIIIETYKYYIYLLLAKNIYWFLYLHLFCIAHYNIN